MVILLAAAAAAIAASPELVSVKRIWAEAPHSAFGDLIRFDNQWFAVFREGKRHVASTSVFPDDGRLRVIVSRDGDVWQPAALVAEDGVDLRDPHFSITPDGRLMIVAGGSLYPNGEFKGRRPRVAFSKDGRRWTAPKAVLEEGEWLWRVSWHKGMAYGISKIGDGDDRYAWLVSSRDGVKWDRVTKFEIPGIDESAARFLKDDTMVILGRDEVGDRRAYIGSSRPPYRNWQWNKADYRIGGPNFIVLPDGSMWAGGRQYAEGGARTFFGPMDLKGYRQSLTLPSGGDNSYPGFVWHDGMVWMLYYSSHEEKTAIYLAKIKVGK